MGKRRSKAPSGRAHLEKPTASILLSGFDVLNAGAGHQKPERRREMNINVATLSGRLGAAPEVKESKGVRYGTFSLAVDEAYKKDGEWQYRPMWFRVVVFGNATKALQKLAKGDWVVVTGSLHLKTYVGDDEKKTYRLEVHARTIDSRPRANGSPAVEPPPSEEPE